MVSGCFRYAVRMFPICCPDTSGISVRMLPKYAYMHAEIKVNDKCIMYISEAKSKQVCENMQFCLTFDGSKEVVENAYEVLSDDAIKIWNPLGMFEWGSYGFALIDKFGIHFPILFCRN